MNRAPLEYIIDYRMEQAKKLFMTGKYNISEVGYMVGYDDMHYFSRLFKQKVGCSPTAFIKNLTAYLLTGYAFLIEKSKEYENIV